MKTFLLILLFPVIAFAQADPHMFMCVQDGRNWKKEMKQDERAKKELETDRKYIETSVEICRELKELVREYCNN